MPGTSYVGQRFGAYEIVALLGVGGMGEVYRAEDTTLGRPVAIKLLPDESGRSEVYVQAFPNPGPKRPVSAGGGRAPSWRRDGQELFYLSQDGRLLTVSVDTRASDIAAVIPRALFPIPFQFASYRPAPDGQQFLFDKVVADPPPVTVVLNWTPPALAPR